MQNKVLCDSVLSSIFTKGQTVTWDAILEEAKVMCPRCVITHGVHLIQRALLRMTFLHCLLNVTLPSHSSDVCWTAVIPRSLGAALGGKAWRGNCLLTTLLQGKVPWETVPSEFSAWGRPHRDYMLLCLLWYWEIVNYHLSLSFSVAKKASAKF